MRYFFEDANFFVTSVAFAGLLICCGEAPRPATVTVPTQHGTSVQSLLKGHACQEGEYDETGLVRTERGLLSYNCTGTLIAPDVVLTAGHCVVDGHTTFTPQPRAVSFAARSTPVTRAVVHPHFDADATTRVPLMMRLRDPHDDTEAEAVSVLRHACGDHLAPNAAQIFETLDVASLFGCILQLPEPVQASLQLSIDSHEVHDVALLFLEKPLLGVPNAALPSSSLAWEGATQGALVGYGENSSSWWRWLTGQTYGERFSGTGAIYTIGKREIYTLPDPTRTRPGDSGGPLFVDTVDGPVIAGVASRGDASRESGAPFGGITCYTRVDAYHDWIAAEIQAFHRQQK